MTEPDPTRVVADADVLAADLLVGDPSRAAIDLLRAHSWLTLIVTEPLLDDATAVIAELASHDLSASWRSRITSTATVVTPTMEGHPALVAAAAGKAATVLSTDARLQSANAGAAIRPYLATSVKSPDAFVRLVDPADLHEACLDAPYPGPDADPRA